MCWLWYPVYIIRYGVKLKASDVMGYRPREIRRFCNFFLYYGGALERFVCDNKYRKSRIPKGGLEVPIAVKVKKNKAKTSAFSRMKEFVDEYYIEPEKMKVSPAEGQLVLSCQHV